jgi:hypothetical protein
MAKSLKQIQAEALNEGNLDVFANNRKDYLSDGETPITALLLGQVAGEFVLKVIENINRLGLTDRGSLTDDLSQGDIEKLGNGGYSVEIGYAPDTAAAKYADYVDKGVKGWQSATKAPNSPYQYRKPQPRPRKRNIGGQPYKPGPMVQAIRGWVERQGLSARFEDQRSGLSTLQGKRGELAGQQDAATTLAFLIARNIKRTGLPTTRYFSGEIDNYFGKAFAQAVAKAIGQDVRIYIRQSQPGQNR